METTGTIGVICTDGFEGGVFEGPRFQMNGVRSRFSEDPKPYLESQLHIIIGNFPLISYYFGLK